MHLITFFLLPFLVFLLPIHAGQKVKVGIDRLFEDNYIKMIKGKKIGLITNHTALNHEYKHTIDVIKQNSKSHNYTLVALFAPEHGITGSAFASEHVAESKDKDNIPIYSLFGKSHRPSPEMLKDIEVLVYDIQDIGARSYTYTATMFYAMEEAAKLKIPFIVLDRPNPLNGITIDGPMLEEKWRSSLGYINIPYCHGMTVAELANFFNKEYHIECQLYTVPMRGWNRSMTFTDTGLPWIPTSPYIPDAMTPFYYPTTGIIGELKLVNIGIGYTLPFKVIGAPWIQAKEFAGKLNEQKFPGVHFEPFYYKPIYGRCAKQACQGVYIVITDPLKFKPVSTQYLIIGMLKSLYPDKFNEALSSIKEKKETLCKLNGTEEVWKILNEEKNIVWKLCGVHAKEKEEFARTRQKYLLAEYQKPST